MTAAKAKHRLMRWCERAASSNRADTRQAVAEEIARAIEKAAPTTCADVFCAPGCPHYEVYKQAAADAAIARRIGGVT